MRLLPRLAAILTALIGILVLSAPALAHPRHALHHRRVEHRHVRYRHVEHPHRFTRRTLRRVRREHRRFRRRYVRGPHAWARRHRIIRRTFHRPRPPEARRALHAVPSPPSVHDALVAMIDGLLASPALAGDQVGFVLMTPSGAIAYARNADERFSPASCRKIMSTACALSLLGPGDRLSTRVEAIGPVSGTVLDGNLELVGGGDPSLDDAALADLARQVHAAGIRTVTGQVVADDSAFDPAESRPGGWSDDDLEWAYAPPISALEADEDRMRDPADGGADDLSAPDPARYAIERFHDALEAAGIQIEGQSLADLGAASPQLLATHLSAPLADLVARTNKPSDNLYAEMLLRQLAIAGPWARQAAETQATESQAAIGATGSAGPILTLPPPARPPAAWTAGPAPSAPPPQTSTLDRALAVERSWLGFDPGTFRLVDGSGLSRYDLLTPRQLASVLLRMRSDAAFVDSLPVAGRDGTLAHRMVGTPAAGQVRAKTGSMSGVSTLAGYIGDRWIVVFMDNGHVGPLSKVRAIQDAICLALARKD